MTPNPEGKEKFDRVSGLVLELGGIAAALGEKYKVAGNPFEGDTREGIFQLKRHRGTWGVVWCEEGEEKRLQDCPLAVKRIFLKIASRFFGDYISMAKEWETTVDQDIRAGEKALSELRGPAVSK